MRARDVATALEEAGWNVWWDRSILPGKRFDEVIEQALDRAGCVVVLWSKMSVKSDWVRSEAAEGLERKVLVPAKLDDIRAPLAYRALHTADLTTWKLDTDHAEMATLRAAVEMVVGSSQTSPKSAPKAEVDLDVVDRDGLARLAREDLLRAVRESREALADDSADVSGDVRSYLTEGLASLLLEELADAEQALRRALALHPRDVEAHYLLGALLMRDGRPDHAESELQLALVFAARRGEMSLLQALIDRGTDVDAADSTGRSALEHAKLKSRRDAVALLESAGARAAESPRDGRG